MSVSSDPELLRQLSTDSVAFEAFYRRHVERVTRFAAGRCKSPADVADAVSATFLTVIGAAPGFDERRGRASAWVLGIAKHEIAALHRCAARERHLAQRVAGNRLLDVDDIARLEAQIDAQRLAPTVARALEDASRSERELFFLVAKDDLSPSEAAQVLGISPVAARVRLVRVRRRVKAALQRSSHGAVIEQVIAKEPR